MIPVRISFTAVVFLLYFVWPGPAAADASADVHSDAQALYRHGLKLERGAGMPRDHRQALESFCAAGAAGHPDAAFSTGWMFLTGTGAAADRRAAAAWFAKAAAAGHGGAQRMARRLASAPAALAVCPSAASPTADHAPPQRLVRMIDRTAKRHGLDRELMLAVVAIESGFRIDAVSPRAARGLMQLTGATALRFGVRDPFDPAQNLDGGARYLRWLLARFDGDVTLALAAYNAGEGAVRRHGGVPPFAETESYIRKVRRYYPRNRHPVDTAPAALPQGPVGTQVADAR